MTPHRRTATIVGVLFITATVTSILGYQAILRPFLNAPDFLARIAENSSQVIAGVLIDSLNSVAVVVIPVLLFPIVRKHSETLAVGYLAARILESVVFIVGHVSLLSLVTISREHALAATPDTSGVLPVGTLLLTVNDWTFLLGSMVVFSLTALILNAWLYRTALVPRFLSVWGLVGAALAFTAGLLAVFGLRDTSVVMTILVVPIAVQEMVFAVWLIVRGFIPSASVARPAGMGFDEARMSSS